MHPTPRDAVGLADLPARLPHLSTALRDVAREVLADPDGTVAGRAMDLARRAGTSTATVARFCHVLGYPTFAVLRRTIAWERAGITLGPLPSGPAGSTPDDADRVSP
jgi:DNA-binding MurR/RpiR family transcriptional regulator